MRVQHLGELTPEDVVQLSLDECAARRVRDGEVASRPLLVVLALPRRGVQRCTHRPELLAELRSVEPACQLHDARLSRGAGQLGGQRRGSGRRAEDLVHVPGGDRPVYQRPGHGRHRRKGDRLSHRDPPGIPALVRQTPQEARQVAVTRERPGPGGLLGTDHCRPARKCGVDDLVPQHQDARARGGVPLVGPLSRPQCGRGGRLENLELDRQPRAHRVLCHGAAPPEGIELMFED